MKSYTDSYTCRRPLDSRSKARDVSNAAQLSFRARSFQKQKVFFLSQKGLRPYGGLWDQEMGKLKIWEQVNQDGLIYKVYVVNERLCR
jgi:hypothetical protein